MKLNRIQLPSSIASSSSLKRLGLGLTFVAASTLGLAAWASPDHEGMAGGEHHHCMPKEGERGAMMARHLDHMLREVHASDAQRAKIKAIEESTAKDLRQDREADRGSREKMMDLLAQPTIDEAAIAKLREEQDAQRRTVSERMTQSMIDIAKVLTPEQRQQLAAKMKKMHEEMRAHHEHEGRHEWHHHAPAAASAASAP